MHMFKRSYVYTRTKKSHCMLTIGYTNIYYKVNNPESSKANTLSKNYVLHKQANRKFSTPKIKET